MYKTPESRANLFRKTVKRQYVCIMHIQKHVVDKDDFFINQNSKKLYDFSKQKPTRFTHTYSKIIIIFILIKRDLVINHCLLSVKLNYLNDQFKNKYIVSYSMT